ncbi:hypothetical protein A5886_000356 [Enterococcus sp. 8G7_MSG3316]|uniref:Uncharacterized protein n=1 Tax=Candidatus Enterococcus testudinis TaxID=1834191 RepID=A0A242A2M3_9ENTE|nr:hypothetical protein [Enterococcus sp. 8G7_MSG3316]OTN75286.1 hypothetical protein A5886_000356 [Enterococcus sp. 8G7_MSG3316]
MKTSNVQKTPKYRLLHKEELQQLIGHGQLHAKRIPPKTLTKASRITKYVK